MPKYWLLKSEPNVYSIDDLQRDGFATWDGVRNYQARNFMRDEMQLGDLALFYHSNSDPSGCVGICRICKINLPDITAWDPSSDHYDPRASKEKPIWSAVEVEFVKKFAKTLPLSGIKKLPEFREHPLLKKNVRLSIMPLNEAQYYALSQFGSQIPQALC